ncbi:hypothetical protein, partial [Georgenia sp.]
MAANTSSHVTTASPTSRSVGRSALRGALLGAGASLVMAAFAMMAAVTYQATGFFTPLYHIASTLISPEAMMTSIAQAADGSLFFFTFGPAVLGAVIHMMIGAMYGAVFAVVARGLRLHGPVLVLGGTVWGAMVFVVSSFVALPVAAGLFGSGDQIAQMASMVGYPTFLVE